MKKSLTDLERELDIARRAFNEGSIYVHTKSGKHYQLLRVSLDEATLGILVTYAPVENTRVLFTRSGLKFAVKFQPRD